MLCGYEWGEDSHNEDPRENLGEQSDPIDLEIPITFSNKMPRYGQHAKLWPYDARIKRWFEIWGHPLNEESTGSDFDKCLIQTNWCDSQNHHMTGDYHERLLSPNQVENFISHLQMLEPAVIFFFGSKMLEIMQDAAVLSQVQSIFGKMASEPIFETKEFVGKKFRVGFQNFERAKFICLPHPSGSRGLSDAYIELFRPEIDLILREFKQFKFNRL